jgi:hypothetical protein
MGSFNTFDQVATAYAETPVLRSDFGRQHDIRPVGARERRWERIVKLDDDTYALLDGYTFGDTAFAPYTYQANYTATREDMEFFAAIVWKRHADGTETLKVRGCGVYTSVATRLRFLHSYLPAFMSLQNRNRDGNHTLKINRSMGGGLVSLPPSITLPKGNGAPEPVREHMRKARAWGVERSTTMQDDIGNVLFRRHTDGQWDLVSKRRGPMRWRVDKDAKTAIKPELQDFWAWGSLMLPMLLPMYAGKHGRPDCPVLGDLAGGNLHTLKADLVREIITTPDHPARVDLLLWMCATAGGWSWTRCSADDLITMAKKHADQTLGLYRKMEVEDFE